MGNTSAVLGPNWGLRGWLKGLVTCILASAPSLTSALPGSSGVVVGCPLWRLKGREGREGPRQSWEQACWVSDGRKLIWLDFPREARAGTRQTRTTTRHQGSSQRSRDMTSDRPTDRQTGTHSRKLQTRQTGQLEHLGAEVTVVQLIGHLRALPGPAEWQAGRQQRAELTDPGGLREPPTSLLGILR